MMIEIAGGVPVPMPLLESNDFSLDLDDFDRHVSPRTKLIILNSPSNPTGGVLAHSDLEYVASRAQEFGAWVLSDEIYSRIVFDGLQVPSIASLPGMAERTIIMDGFSKTYAMTGWRLGFGIMPEALAERVGMLLTHSVGCTAHFTQIAGIEALTGPQASVDHMIEEFQRRRDLIVDGLNRLPGVHCRRPQGAFYAFPNVSLLGFSAAYLADRFLEAGVAVLPGTAFGQRGEGYLRLAFANSAPNIERALGRIAQAIQSLS
jgi:aspartate/methionine/tyrosine aminotransferase